MILYIILISCFDVVLSAVSNLTRRYQPQDNRPSFIFVVSFLYTIPSLPQEKRIRSEKFSFHFREAMDLVRATSFREVTELSSSARVLCASLRFYRGKFGYFFGKVAGASGVCVPRPGCGALIARKVLLSSSRCSKRTVN